MARSLVRQKPKGGILSAERRLSRAGASIPVVARTPPRQMAPDSATARALHADCMAKLKERQAAGRPIGRYSFKPHQNSRERMRRLRQSWRQVERLKDEASVKARADLFEAVKDDPEPEFARMNLAMGALNLAKEENGPWALAVEALLSEYSRIAAESEDDSEVADA